ncbi:MAG: hypothetical protein JKY53_13320 [Flavobacteriales bacterium]|nr:hypothetical protein [Flavobacteriales bacterium]
MKGTGIRGRCSAVYSTLEELTEGKNNPKYKSYSEEIVGDAIENAGIRFNYEKGVFIVDNSNEEQQVRLWYPDFYLPELDIILEYVGMPDNEEYMKGIAKKKQVYDDMDLSVVWIYPNDIWEESDGKYSKRRNVHEVILSKIYDIALESNMQDELRKAV